MFFFSIYKRLVRDFGFVKDFGFEYSHDVIHYTTPSVAFKGLQFDVAIGYNHEDECFYAFSFNFNDRRIPDADVLERFKQISPTKPYPLLKSSAEFKSLLEGEVIVGKSYKKQVEQAKNRLLKNLTEYLKSSD